MPMSNYRVRGSVDARREPIRPLMSESSGSVSAAADWKTKRPPEMDPPRLSKSKYASTEEKEILQRYHPARFPLVLSVHNALLRMHLIVSDSIRSPDSTGGDGARDDARQTLREGLKDVDSELDKLEEYFDALVEVRDALAKYVPRPASSSLSRPASSSLSRPASTPPRSTSSRRTTTSHNPSTRSSERPVRTYTSSTFRSI